MLIDTFLWHWEATTVQNTVLGTYAVSGTLLANTYAAHKLEGFNLVRGTACLRVQLAANPFQCGKLLVHFLPNQANFTAVDPSYVAMHNSCLATKTQQPGLELDVRDSAGLIKIPFISPANWCKVGTGYYDWGTFYISVLAPMRTGAAGEDVVMCSVYLYFEDVEVAAPIYSQSTLSGSKKKFRTISGAAKEAELLEHKPISDGLRLISSGASLLSSIPMLSGVAGGVAWASDVASGTASYLGYSKPVNLSEPVVAARQTHRYLATSDGVDDAVPLGLISNNAIAITDGTSIYNEDEMSFAFLKSRKALIDTVLWHSTGDLQGTQLYFSYVTPSSLYDENTTTAGAHVVTWRAGPPVYYMFKDFGLWRGSIEYTFKFVKTSFHRGKVEITFTPNYPVTSTPTVTTSQMSLREIVDLSVSDEIIIVCPYMLATDYVSTLDYSGIISLKVLNELRSPETVAADIDILVYARAGPDFEYQAPGNRCTIDERSIVFSPQSKVVVDEGIGNEPLKGSVNTLYSTSVNGEMLCSVKQILKRNSIISYRTTLTDNNSAKIWPYFAGITYVTAAGLQAPSAGGDPYSKYSCMYAYYRGKMVVTARTSMADTANAGRNNSLVGLIIPQDPLVTLENVLSFDRYWAWYGTSDWAAATTRQGTQGYALTDAGVGVHSYVAPYYGRTKCSLALKQTTSNRIPAENSQSWTCVNMEGQDAFETGTFYRNVGEDFQFSYFIGCPPLFVSIS